MRKLTTIKTYAWVLLSLTFLKFLNGSLGFHPVSPQRSVSPYFPVKNSRARRCASIVSSRSSHQSLRIYSSAFPEGDDSPNKKNWKKNPLVVVKKVVARFTATWVLLAARFQALSKKAKFLVATQLLALTLLLGAGAKQVVTNVAGPTVSNNAPIEIPFSTFMDLCENKETKPKPNEPAVQIGSVVVDAEKIGYRVVKLETEEQRIAFEKVKKGESTDVEIPQRQAYTRKVSASPELISFLRENEIPFQAASKSGRNAAYLAIRSFILTFYLLIMFRMYRTMNGGGGSSGAPGKLASSELPLAKFDDIEGIDNAKFEVMELVDTLRNPGKYSILGARAPTGLLLEGPPGTGKTMLARATAATAGVPLLYCSGSDFVEMFVGRGAARVRKTFARAAKLSPCIIFIDELDALGKSRDNGMMGSLRSNDEAEQTLNQLLACMDGLDSSRGVCVLAATNRRDVLDPALIRPGRFDRIIKVELPDANGRERILRVHAKKLPGFKEGKGIDDKRPGSLGKGNAVDLSAVAAVLPGLSGAELEFIVNEAAIRAVRRVSGQLREGKDPNTIAPSVLAEDFEDSVASYYESRRPNGKGMGELLSNVLRK